MYIESSYIFSVKLLLVHTRKLVLVLHEVLQRLQELLYITLQKYWHLSYLRLALGRVYFPGTE